MAGGWAAEMEEACLLAFWGKTLRSSDNSSQAVFNDTEGQLSYKPVLHHLMDVAAVALRWQQLNRARLEREAALLKASPECLSKITAFLAGVHDLGKLSGEGTRIVARSDPWPEGSGPRPPSLAQHSYPSQSRANRPKVRQLIP